MNCQQCNTTNPADSPYCNACGAKLLKATNDPLIGRVFLNQYTITKKLGQGGFGSVYEAMQPSVGRKAVLKILHQHLSHSPEIAVRFRREGLAASKLTHPSIVRVYNFGETDDGLIWIAMEHVDGETLSARLRRQGPLSTKELCDVLGPICDALTEAHSKGIIHRDLKPDNIMLCHNKDQGATVKLLDFGVAGLVDDIQVTSTGMMSGSPPYMPPEQWRGLKYTDHRSDVYALGVVAYQCLSGRLPFDADTSPAWMQKHCNEPPIELQGISKATTSVILKAMAKAPEERFASAQDFSKALKDAEQGVTQALPKSLTPNNEKAKAPVAFYALALLGVLAAFAVGVFIQRPPTIINTQTPTPNPNPAPSPAPTTAPTSALNTKEATTTAPTQTSTETQPRGPRAPKTNPKPTKTETPKPPESIKEKNIEAERYVKQYFSQIDFSPCNKLPEPLNFAIPVMMNTNGDLSGLNAFPPKEEARNAMECAQQKIISRSFPDHPPGEDFSFYINISMRADFSKF